MGTKQSFTVGLMFSLTLSVALSQAQEGRAPGQQESQAEVSSRPAGTVVRPGSVLVPASAIARPEDAGKFAHTNIKIFAPAGIPLQSVSPDNTFAEYPASIACVYKVGPSYTGCVPANNGKHASGGWGAIAIVDAYDDPNAASDLAYFDTFFGLPKANFTTIYANSSWGAQGTLGLTASCSGVPDNAKNHGWDLEEALDIEWSHAMSPSAHIILVEACTNGLNDLAVAESVAGYEVGLYGGGDISNSWGTGEFSGQTQYDPYFFRDYWSHTSYFASAGDGGWGAAYPSSSPWVVSAGGTTINRDASGNFLSESCWGGSGGGVSTQEIWQNPPNINDGMGPWSDFQYPMVGGFPFTTGARMTPDMSFDADPASGVWVRDTDSGGSWFVVGGTSVASPSLAGLVNSAGQKLGQAPGGGLYYSTAENNLIYSQLFAKTAYPNNFYDVTTGSNGTGHNAGTGYDQCTGVGSPRGKLGK